MLVITYSFILLLGNLFVTVATFFFNSLGSVSELHMRRNASNSGTSMQKERTPLAQIKQEQPLEILIPR